MTSTLQILTAPEIARLMSRNLTENMRVAICIHIEDTAEWSHDAYDCPTFRGNALEAWFKANPVFGPEQQVACPLCGGWNSPAFGCDCDVPF